MGGREGGRSVFVFVCVRASVVLLYVYILYRSQPIRMYILGKRPHDYETLNQLLHVCNICIHDTPKTNAIYQSKKKISINPHTHEEEDNPMTTSPRLTHSFSISTKTPKTP